MEVTGSHLTWPDVAGLGIGLLFIAFGMWLFYQSMKDEFP